MGLAWCGGAGSCVCFPLGGGYIARVRCGGWLLVVGHRAVRGCPSRLPGLTPGVLRSVGRVGSLWRGAQGPLRRSPRDRSVATRGTWSLGARVGRSTVWWAQGGRERRLWAGCGPPRLCGPRGGVLRLHGRVAALVRRPWVANGCVRLESIVSMVGGGLGLGRGVCPR